MNENNTELEYVEQKNPNYWFDNYQQSGDRFHLPQTDLYHFPEWKRIAELQKNDQNINIVNCSYQSKIPFIDRRHFLDVLEFDYKPLLNNLTFAIKTFERVNSVKRLINSINKFYPNTKILVVDDSKEIWNHNMNITYIKTEFDIGLSEGRNILIKNIKTKYFVLLDDDFIFTEKTDLLKGLKILGTTKFDIVGGSVYDIGPNAKSHNQPRDYYGSVKIDNNNNINIKNHLYNEKLYNKYNTYDIVMNFFIAKTESIKKVMWDPQYKLGEHLDFFLRAKKHKLYITYCPEIQINHMQDINTIEYNKYRLSASKYINLFKQNNNIKNIFKNNLIISG